MGASKADREAFYAKCFTQTPDADAREPSFSAADVAQAAAELQAVYVAPAEPFNVPYLADKPRTLTHAEARAKLLGMGIGAGLKQAEPQPSPLTREPAPPADFWSGTQRVRPWNCEVPFPVPVAHFYRYTSMLNPTGLTPYGARYVSDVASAVLPTLREHTGRIAVRLEFHEPLRTQAHRAGDPPLRRNLHLYVNPCMVALRLAGLWCDDAQIERLEVRRDAPAGDGAVMVTLLALPNHW